MSNLRTRKVADDPHSLQKFEGLNRRDPQDKQNLNGSGNLGSNACRVWPSTKRTWSARLDKTDSRWIQIRDNFVMIPIASPRQSILNEQNQQTREGLSSPQSTDLCSEQFEQTRTPLKQ
jgi:hypothetical protein